MKTHVSIGLAILAGSCLAPQCLGQHARADLDGMPIFGMPSGNRTGSALGQYGPIPRTPYLGLELRDLTASRARELGFHKTQGVEVISVLPGSPGAAAGFKSHDIVMDYDGETVASKAQLSQLVDKTFAGRQVKIGVWRAGAELTLSASIDAVYQVGQGVSAPVLLRKVEPEYTEAARKAKHEGTVLLYVQINADGDATNIRVVRSLGLGLDEKAVECVKQWKFKPGYKGNRPVTVEATIEVNFRL